ASYNVGFGHVKDAQLLGRRLGKNPNRWNDLKVVLPLLAKKKYYQDLPHRYARGWEPVQYVTRIREYRKILDQVVKQQDKNQQVEI
ncbi:MAG: membrane-bound lytic murein transglycosylase MltF, partial [Nitrospirota bacterium]|nr:membrane-bound lytic murein transglycosylase MltF [Nitrospirota bacterium]